LDPDNENKENIIDKGEARIYLRVIISLEINSFERRYPTASNQKSLKMTGVIDTWQLDIASAPKAALQTGLDGQLCSPALTVKAASP
jgi:hypothetical protein